MLGRTNITNVKGGTVVSNVEDLAWNEVGTLSVEGSFKRAVWGNNTLVAVTGGGNVIYSKDGENWEEAVFKTNAEYKIVDGVWDGKRFVFAANDPAIIITEDFQEYEYYAISGVKRLYAIFYNTDGTYTIIGAIQSIYSDESTYKISFLKGMPENLKEVGIIDSMPYSERMNKENCDILIENIYVKTAHSSNAVICYVKSQSSISEHSKYSHQLCISEDGTSVRRFIKSYWSVAASTMIPADVYTGASNKFKIFSFKNALYYMDTLEENKKLVRLKDFSDEKGDVVSTGKDWGFIEGEYFNKCGILVNANQMLVVKPGEYIAEKTIEDLIDITYDFSIRNIIKAFGKLYLFGTKGHILVSSDEIKNENALAVKTMSATRALYEAKVYTDEKYKELEERIAKFEGMNNNSSTEV